LSAHPRDSVIDYKRSRLYISIMGRRKVGVIDMDTWKVVKWIKTGGGPRHISLDPAGRYMYVSVKWSSKLLKIDLDTHKIVDKLKKGLVDGPASMEITPDGRYLYMVNYYGDFVTKVRTRDFRVMKRVRAKHHPVGLTYDALTGRVWISCYSGYVMVFQG
jgi:DNA-binding beta-propeller fold protein YncE